MCSNTRPDDDATPSVACADSTQKPTQSEEQTVDFVDVFVNTTLADHNLLFSQMAPIVLGYWAIRGLAQPIRLLLAASDAEFVDELYKVGPAPELSREEWTSKKQSIGLDFPNLPYLIDGDVKISQSIAIMRYIGRKYGLDGKTEAENIRIELIEQQLNDWRRSQQFYNPEFEKLVVGYKKELPDKLTALSKFLGANEFLGGGGLSYVDFIAYEWLDVHRLLVPGLLADHPTLEAYVKRIESIPEVKKYMESGRFIKWPVNNDAAKWGSRLTPL